MLLSLAPHLAKSSRGGFTLLEATLAFVFAAIAATTLASLIAKRQSLADQAKRRFADRVRLENAYERLRLEAFDSLPETLNQLENEQDFENVEFSLTDQSDQPSKIRHVEMELGGQTMHLWRVDQP